MVGGGDIIVIRIFFGRPVYSHYCDSGDFDWTRSRDFFQLNFSRKNLGVMCLFFSNILLSLLVLLFGDLIYSYFNWYLGKEKFVLS